MLVPELNGERLRFTRLMNDNMTDLPNELKKNKNSVLQPRVKII